MYFGFGHFNSQSDQMIFDMVNFFVVLFVLSFRQIFTVIEAMADGAVKQGVPRQMALQFAAQTVLGAAKTVIQTEKHPAILRDEVNSKK